ncbi:MAG: SusC/RagA family TonB-linked outer membrane protein [Williamsia sp.]|nr:SusC/RagA family TonB-linked outer membrane protein [Williamsia sp.]
MQKFMLFVLLSLLAIAVRSQTASVTGQVRDEKGEPVPFATVRIKGRPVAVSADQAGNFTIQAAKGSVLQVSGAGFEQSEITVGNESTVQISLKSQSVLREVVVTALGQSTSKAKIGYSTTTFNNENLNRASPANVFDNLAGKIPGANISKVGGPGSSTKVVLRGYGVIAGGSNNPLYVIDGVPLTDNRYASSDNYDFGNGINDLNPNDIESINVLRGTAAASLYGSSAKNGAIMITTRRGRAGKLKIDYLGSATFSQVGKIPKLQDQFGQGWGGVFILSENGSWGPRLDGQQRLWGSVVDNSQLLKPFSAVENNMRDFYNIGTEYNNSLALSGGNESNTFYFSYGNLKSDGVLPTKSDYYERNSFALRTTSKFKNLNFNTSFNYTNKRQNVPFTGQGGSDGASLFEEILQIPVDIPIRDLKNYRNKFFNVDNYFTPFAENPYYPLYENANRQNSDRFFGNFDLSYKFTPWLSSQLRIGGDFTNARTSGHKAVNAPAPGSWNAGGNVEGATRAADVGSVTEQSGYSGVLNGDFIVKASKEFGEDFNLDALVGVNYNQQQTRNVTSTITKLTVPGFYNLSNTSDIPVTTGTRTLRRLIGGYAQATLGYRNQVYLTLNARNDWSSTLPISNNHFFYPGGSLSWLASQTLNLGGTAISLLKLRASYGKTGSDAAPYQVNAILGTGNVTLPFGSIVFPFNGVTAYGVSNTIGNLNLKPIITSEAELGTEIRFFQNRLGLDVAVYDKRTEGQIFTVPITPSSGYTGLVQNLGLVENKGVEVAFDVKPVDTKDFTWLLNYTFSKNWNKVLNLNGGPQKVVLNTAYAAELDAYPGKNVSGIYAPVAEYTPDGRIVVNSTTGMPVAAADKGFYGNAAYDYLMGMQNTLTYKNWQLSFSLDFRKGGVMYSGTADLSLFVGNSYMTTYNDRRPFIIPNSVNAVTDAGGKTTYVENKTPIDETSYTDYFYPTQNLATSYQYRIIDKSFLKMRDISLTYKLPAAWMSKIRATNLAVSAFAKNFLLWTPKSNIYLDPEASNLGNDLASELGEFRTAPIPVMYGISLKASF